MSEQTRILYSSPVAAATVVGDVHISVYRGALTREALIGVSTAHRDLIARYPEGTCVLSYAELNTPLPSAEARELTAELTKEFAPGIRCSVTVIGGQGFWASAVRSVVTATLVLSRNGYPVKIMSTIEEGAAYAAANSKVPGVTGERLVQAVALLRESS